MSDTQQLMEKTHLAYDINVLSFTEKHRTTFTDDEYTHKIAFIVVTKIEVFLDC